MASFKDTRDALLISYDDGDIDDDEFLLLWEQFTSKNPSFPCDYEPFDLDTIDPSECKAEFRVEKNDIHMLADALDIPDVFTCPQRSICNGIEGLCCVLKRFAYPTRYSDMIPRFAKPVPVLSMITNTVIDYLYDTHAHRITQWNNFLLNNQMLEQYADSIAQKGSALDNCFGFIDGTVRPICRPGENQRIVYNGHKRVHALKYQSVTLPSGMIAHLCGPFEGKKHDAGMLRESQLLNDLQRHAFSTTGNPMCLYGDPAYPLRVHLLAPYKHARLTPQEQAFNTSMSTVRESVEWLFGDIVEYFKFLDFKKNLKIQLSSIGKYYIVAAILRNALTCLYGNQTSQFFDFEPPMLHEYFN
ncbi:uncharacterized protein LOC110232447 [Exaiptasia diaphana]|uniref:DDE Tnp4 domain-containing protein n=1 Tax=Exaiptasia diaphana TaxID=2652724 RepID=A0A913WS75_EXADI|nr:uncharacterized protein LOC110232447 [Exaiptasia diaphana]KXJ18454.1 hypothetical protein AC249_AIPGENE27990 [Exaiptasia diaphana]